MLREKRIRIPHIFISCFFYFFSLPVITYSAVIVEYDIAANTTTAFVTSIAPGTVASNVLATSITLGPNLTLMDGSFYDGGSFCALVWSRSGTPDPDAYFQIQITPDGIPSITYTSMIFALAVDNSPPDYVGPPNFVLRYSTDGTNFTDLFTGTLSRPDDVYQEIFNVDISSIGTVSGPVYFRLYGYGPYDDSLGDTLCLANAPSDTTNFNGTGANVVIMGETSKRRSCWNLFMPAILGKANQ